MPAISQIRFTNVIFEGGGKRFNDDIFQFDGNNGIILLENGGGKTVFVQTAVQTILPHQELPARKLKDTLLLQGNSAHVAIEWILNQTPRRYALTAVTLFMKNEQLASHRYVYEYEAGDKHAIEKLPFVRSTQNGALRPASQGEMQDYYQYMTQKSMLAQTFPTIAAYHRYLEENFKIIPTEWKKIVDINGAEGDVERFFDGCQTTTQLVDRLLIPTVEEALSSSSTEDFVELFDKQRVRFKEHKQLQRQLDENKNIEERVNHFVARYKMLDQLQQRWLADKQQAKAFFHLTTTEKEENDRQLETLQKQHQECLAAQKALLRKGRSLEIRMLEQEHQEIKAQYSDIAERYFEYQKQWENAERRYNSLKVAQIKQKLAQYQQQKLVLEEQLQQLQQSPETAKLEGELTLVKGQIKWYFVQLEQNIQQNLKVKEQQIEQYEQEQKELQQQIKVLQKKLNDAIVHIATCQQEIKSTDTLMQELKKHILINPDEEQVEQALPQLEKKAAQLETNQWDFTQKLRELNQQQEYLEELIKEKSSTIAQINNQLTRVSTNIQNIEIAAERLKEQLINNNPDLARFSSPYKNEASLIAQLEEKVEYLNKQKQDLLEQERLAFRFVDDYSQQQIFTADPLLEKLASRWQSQFPYLELGSSFIERALQNGNYGSGSFFLWPITLITAAADTEKLIKNLEPQREKLTHPIIVMSSLQARALLDGQPIDLDVIEPANWQTNIYQEQFSAWKEQVSAQAAETKQQREQCEQAYEKTSNLLSQVRTFYQSYPFTAYEELKQQQIDLSAQTEQYHHDLTLAEEQLKHTEREHQLYQERLQEAEREKSAIEKRLLDGQLYLEQKGINEGAQIEKHHWQQQQREYDREHSRLDRNYRFHQEVIGDFKIEIGGLKKELALLQANEDYKSVQHLEPVFSDFLLLPLKSRQRNLEAALAKEHDNWQTIQSNLERCRQDIDTQQNELKLVRESIPGAIDEDLEFPPYGEQELWKLVQDKNRLAKKMTPIKADYQRLQEEQTAKESAISTHKEIFTQEFPSVPVDQFDQPLDIMREKLKAEEKTLAAEKQVLLQRQHQLQQQEKLLNNLYNEIKGKNERYGFLADHIEVAILEERVRANYPYQREKILEQLFEQLASGEQQVNQEQQHIEELRQQLIEYCNGEVKDIRVRQDVIGGLRSNKNYTEVVEWHQRMQRFIRHIIMIIEGDLRKHDTELEHFISYLHDHLRSIKVELEQLPKKTRVKVDDKWKDIFIFHVPDWQEEEGKKELRRQIYWMLGELEDSRFKDESGQEDATRVRKAIEKWLQSKQLLRAVMKNETIKVRCRKVSNDGKVSGGIHSWEESNRWSGGEKWSKNMTLFLGILNYLAEKRQYINSNLKRHRSVILDNPFGKASSDHVLEPVFFVAEQLGFQIIALTAHTEGNFIRNYFPVVYSCRLRQAEESDKLIMTKEKEIKKAYFQDHDPQALERLGEYNQVSLF
jgi:hypothetical protein